MNGVSYFHWFSVILFSIQNHSCCHKCFYYQFVLHFKREFLKTLHACLIYHMENCISVLQFWRSRCRFWLNISSQWREEGTTFFPPIRALICLNMDPLMDRMFECMKCHIYIMWISFIGGGNQRKPPTCRKSLTNFIT